MVVRILGGVLHVLLIRDPYQNWGLPKGHLEQGEDPPAAAVREVEEETGLANLDLGPELGAIDWYFRKDDKLIHKVCSFFLIHSVDGDLIPEVSEGITECEWLPAEEALVRITYENAREMVRAAIVRVGEEAPAPGAGSEGANPAA